LRASSRVGDRVRAAEDSATGRLRFLFYSHDGVGLGHVRRNLAIAHALTDSAPEASIVLVTSVDEPESLGVPGNVDILKLPGLRKLGNERYASRRLRISPRDIGTMRAALLEAAVESFEPTVVLVDKHPLGASGELRRALAALEASRGRAVLGLRDVLDDRNTVVREWTRYDLARRISEHYDRVLVYGKQAVFDPVSEYQLSSGVRERTRYCGYVVNPRRAEDALDGPLQPLFSDRGNPVVLATAGGGEDGFPLLATFIEAAREAPWEGMVIAGPQSVHRERRILRRMAAEAGVAFSTFVPDLVNALGAVDALVCMGGYNTLAEAAASGVPTVCVPRTRPRTEQLIRAQAFARLGLLRLIEPDRLDVSVLKREVDSSLEASRERRMRRARATLGLDGAANAARELLELAREPARVVERRLRVAT
jgi:predicted glycosyltransferase